MTTTVNNSENPEKAIDDELALIEYLTKKKYPLDAARIIRESFEEKQRLEEQNGEICYKKGVWLVHISQRCKVTIIQ